MSSFNSCPLSASSRGSFVSLHFLPRGWCHLHIWGYWYFSWKFWFQLELHLLGILHDIACIYIKEAGWQYTALMCSFSNLELICCSMSNSNYCFLTCIQISKEAGKVVWYSHDLKNFPQFVVILTIKGFSVVNEAEVVLFMAFPCFLYDQWMLTI